MRLRWIATAFVLSGCVGTSVDLRAAESKLDVVHRWDFGANEDAKADRWPDDWTRRTGVQYPKYLSIGITRRATSKEDLAEIEQFRRTFSQWSLAWKLKKFPWQITPESTPKEFDQWLERSVLNPYLEFQMDGGAAEIVSPLLPVERDSVYGIHCQGMANDPDLGYELSATLTLLDRDRKVVLERSTRSLRGVENWQSLTTNDQYPFDPRVAFAQIRLRVAPLNSKAFRGRFGIDAIELIRSPRLALQVNKPSGIFRVGEKVIVQCTATGMTELQSSLDLQLKDHTGRIARRATKELEPLTGSNAMASHLVALDNSPAHSSPSRGIGKADRWQGECRWELEGLEPGYYEVRTQLERSRADRFELIDRFVVLTDTNTGLINNQIGLSIPEDRVPFDRSLDKTRWLELLREMHVGRIKLPIWFDPRDVDAGAELASRIDQFQSSGIRCVGVIATPPPSLIPFFPKLKTADTASSLEDPHLTQSYLDPVIQSMCSRLVHFQLGWDDETDFANSPGFKPSLEAIEKTVKRFGQDVQLIAAHNPVVEVDDAPSIDTWQLHSPVAMSSSETKRLLTNRQGDSSRPSLPWLSVTPISQKQYGLETRVRDLTERMVMLTESPWNGQVIAWAFDPASENNAILSSAGGPAEMFIPFRNLASTLASVQNLGSLPTARLGRNAVLVRDDQASLLIWGPQNVQANLYLGRNIRARDLWGRTVPVDNKRSSLGPIQSIEIRDWPVVIEGIDLYAARWRMGMSIVTQKLDVVVGREEFIEVSFENPFPFPVSGTLLPVCSALNDDQSVERFQVEANGMEKVAIPVRLSPYANTGPAPIEIVASIEGPDGPVTITAEDELQIGSDEFEFEVSYNVGPDGELIVEVEAINRGGKPGSFDCYVKIPGRTRQRTQIANLTDRSRRTFVFEDASELLGSTIWLQCEQIGDGRVMNKRVQVTN
ncbi:hypothetical protein VN12_03255 [Pirellula sp. SH-Sr6A]|nr:hypothetical protein VN12_03255 [Pirellula sp. SH-Sr6A]